MVCVECVSLRPVEPSGTEPLNPTEGGGGGAAEVRGGSNSGDKRRLDEVVVLNIIF